MKVRMQTSPPLSKFLRIALLGDIGVALAHLVSLKEIGFTETKIMGKFQGTFVCKPVRLLNSLRMFLVPGDIAVLGNLTKATNIFFSGTGVTGMLLCFCLCEPVCPLRASFRKSSFTLPFLTHNSFFLARSRRQGSHQENPP